MPTTFRSEVDDPRPDDLLEECGRIASRLRLALAWSDGIEGAAAKTCSRGGADAWKMAKPISEDENAAAGYFKTRARRRNPAVVAGASGLILVENDGGDELLGRFGLPALPSTVAVRSRRGVHRYFRPPAGKPPLKVQLADDGITTSSDGYLIGGGALHPSGHVYRYENGAIELAELPIELYELIVRLGQETSERTWHKLEDGAPISKGSRNDAIFHRALELTRSGKARPEILEELLRINAEQCQPPLAEEFVRKQLSGALKWARAHPTVEQELRRKARQLLDERKGRKRSAQGELIISMSDFLVGTGEEGDWLVDYLIARYAISLVAGLPKVGKSTFVYAAIAAITRVGEFLELPVRQADVLLLTEEPPATVEEKVDRFGIDEDRVHVLAKRRARGKLGWARIVEEAVRYCTEHPQIELVVVDTIDKFADITAKRSEADTGVILEMAEPLYGLLALGVAVVLITHQRKEEGLFGLRVRGGTALTGTADIIVEVERLPLSKGAPANARVLKIVSRYADTPDEITVELDGDKWTASGTVKAAVRRWRGERVLELLTGAPETFEEILDRAVEDLSERTLRRRLSELVDDGRAEVSGEGVKGDPLRWRLSQTQPGFVPPPKSGFGINPENPHNQAAGFVPTPPGGYPRPDWHESESAVTRASVPTAPSSTPGRAGTNPAMAECALHGGLHAVVKQTAGITYLTCGCTAREAEPAPPKGATE
jgi:AAA domain/Bifunctional DNA primase/polymerase, N-terminal/Primase C terminal 1 (PriCT-1)